MSRLKALYTQEVKTLRQSLKKAATRITRDAAVNNRRLFTDGSGVLSPNSSGSLAGLGRRGWELIDFKAFTAYMICMRQSPSSDGLGEVEVSDFQLAISCPHIAMREAGSVYIHTLGSSPSATNLQAAGLYVDHLILLAEALDALYTADYLESHAP